MTYKMYAHLCPKAWLRFDVMTANTTFVTFSFTVHAEVVPFVRELSIRVVNGSFTYDNEQCVRENITSK